jgi:hypothetical protein
MGFSGDFDVIPYPPRCGYLQQAKSWELRTATSLAGGVLVGQDLIKVAQTRAQITQIQKFDSAANTFVTKYGYLPGDIPAAVVTQFGFTAAPGAIRASHSKSSQGIGSAR